MFKSVFTKTLYNMRWAIVGWSLAVFFIAFLTMIVFDALSQKGIADVVAQTPDQFKSLVGDASDFTTVSGYIGQQIFGPNGVIFTMIAAIMIFVGISASKEDNGQLQSLLALPVSRTKVYLQQWLAASLAISFIVVMLAPGTWLALLILGHSADASRFWQSMLECILVNLAYGLVAYATAMAFGKKSLTIMIGAGYAAVSFIISSLAPAVGWLKWPDRFSVYHYYNNPQVMNVGITWSDLAVLVGVIVALSLIGWVGFRLRDVRT